MAMPRDRSWKIPFATATVLTLSVVITCASYSAPVITQALQRNPSALMAGEIWRIITPLFVQPDPWPITLSIWGLLVASGVAAEQLFGMAGWLALYFTGAIVGEIAGYAWQPTGSGGSIAVAGLLGGLLAWFLSKPTPWFAKIGVTIVIAGAFVDTWVKDIHGLPLLAGIFVGALLLRPQRVDR
jgi:membrane associated rhomboid family serine protease